MPTLHADPVVSKVRPGRDQWVAIPASRGTYLRLLDDRGERSRPKLIYLDGRLTIVSPGFSHERLRTRVESLLKMVLTFLDVPFISAGKTTLKDVEKQRRGCEPDASFYLTRLDGIRDKTDLVMGRDPAPDLAIEVVVSHPVDDALAAFGSFGVREVWVCEGGALRFLAPGGDGRYAPSPVSVCLPFLASDEMEAWVYRDDLPDEATHLKLFIAWVTQTLAPRAGRQRPGGGAPLNEGQA